MDLLSRQTPAEFEEQGKRCCGGEEFIFVARKLVWLVQTRAFELA